MHASLHAPGMRPTFSLHVPYMPSCMLPACSLHAPCMPPACSMHAPCNLQTCSLQTPCMPRACTMHAPDMLGLVRQNIGLLLNATKCSGWCRAMFGVALKHIWVYANKRWIMPQNIGLVPKRVWDGATRCLWLAQKNDWVGAMACFRQGPPPTQNNHIHKT